MKIPAHICRFPCLSGLLLLVSNAFGQGLKYQVAAFEKIKEALPVEKVSLHLDKPYYAVGDTIWYKAYVVNADYLTASKRSGLLYVELANDSNRVIRRVMLPVIMGLTWGNIALNADEVADGNYVLRAYTQWMRNFGETYVFKRELRIAGGEQSWRVKLANQLSGDSLRLSLRFDKDNTQALGLREMLVKVLDGKKEIFRKNVETGTDGSLDLAMQLPPKTPATQLTLLAEDLRKGEGGRKISIPLPVNRPGTVDVQFLPEGGSLVAGLPGRVGFKAIGEDGKGTEVRGRVVRNGNQQEVAVFNTGHLGMGSFNLAAKAGEQYTALVQLPDKSIKSYPLPAVAPVGTVLHVDNLSNKDSLIISMGVLNPGMSSNVTYSLIAQSRGVICHAFQVRLTANTVRKISRDLFPTGVARFTLLDAAGKPLNERIVFIRQPDDLDIRMNGQEAMSVTARDSVPVNIHVTDRNGAPIEGSFSLAVTTDNLVKTDTFAPTILTDLLLTSELQGTVERPGYYFDRSNADADTDLDNLMLTQGWVGYDWNQVTKPAEPVTYAAEPEFTVQGKVKSLLNKPVAGTEVLLLSTRKPPVLMSAVTDSLGSFRFAGFTPADTLSFMLQTRNKRGKSFNVNLEIDAPPPPKFTAGAGRLPPSFVNADTTLLSYFKTTRKRQQQVNLPENGKLLNEISIVGRKVVKGSKNLNGAGKSDFTMDEKDIAKLGKITLGELLAKNIRGFGPGIFPPKSRPPVQSYLVKEKEMRLVIDGIDADYFFVEDEQTINGRFMYLKDLMEFFTADEITGIELMYSGTNNYKYGQKFLTFDQLATPGYPTSVDWAFIEVTTRSGKGPFMKKTAGVALHKPLAFTFPRKFYRPKYLPGSTAPDLRTTIHWEPNIVTNASGNAFVSFYAGAQPGTYTLLIEGADMNGKAGVSAKTIVVKK
ncbi:hypothetical protein [Hufsiella ginkgonis]|uniref:Carboxypeptidase regulatory-like domain-containing protein n=1 Tax=Hufsiella ginkgonis TaxID=2695274 RepID=A0A7K1XXL2_9SPHI|nr:hypothetical protein [Hufsiella ginkgonis]MXV15744.1 hypothetical protein [Hufsiella ginkgonis]